MTLAFFVPKMARALRLGVVQQSKSTGRKPVLLRGEILCLTTMQATSYTPASLVEAS